MNLVFNVIKYLHFLLILHEAFPCLSKRLSGPHQCLKTRPTLHDILERLMSLHCQYQIPFSQLMEMCRQRRELFAAHRTEQGPKTERRKHA